MFDTFKRWKNVRFYPLMDPPKGRACEAVNTLRSMCGFDELEPEVFRVFYDRPMEELELFEAEGVEHWVDPETQKSSFTWKEIESFEDNTKKFTHGLYNSMFDHLQRIPERFDLKPNMPGAVYSYQQDTARRYWWKIFVPYYFFWMPILFGVASFFGYAIFSSLTNTETRSTIWKFIVDTGGFIYDYIIPILVGLSSLVWLFDYAFNFFKKRE